MRVRQSMFAFAAVVIASGFAASSATAASLFVSKAGSDANSCSEPAPCLTIARALEASATSAEPSTITVAAGEYAENLTLADQPENSVTIIGAGAGQTDIAGAGATPTVAVAAGITAILSGVEIRHAAAGTAPAVETDGRLTLESDNVVGDGASHENGVVVDGKAGGSLTDDGGGITLEHDANGTAVRDEDGSITLDGATVAGDTTDSEGVDVEDGTATINGSSILMRASGGAGVRATVATVHMNADRFESSSDGDEPIAATDAAIVVAHSRIGARGAPSRLASSTLTLERDEVEQNGAASALVLRGPSVLDTDHARIGMNDRDNDAPALLLTGSGSADIEAARIAGSWTGAGIRSEGTSSLSLLDSHVATAGASHEPALELSTALNDGPGLLVRRSFVGASASAPAAVSDDILEGGAIFDSSVISGGADAIALSDEGPKEARVAIAASTVNAGATGAANDPGFDALSAYVGGEKRRLAVAVEGSILFDPVSATLGAQAGEADVVCSNSDLPSQSQSGGASTATIACRAGASGNSEFTNPRAVFQTPLGEYMPSRSSRALNSVLAADVKLPYGQRESTTDLNGYDRARFRRKGRRCLLVQDRGAEQRASQRRDCRPR